MNLWNRICCAVGLHRNGPLFFRERLVIVDTGTGKDSMSILQAFTPCLDCGKETKWGDSIGKRSPIT
jgi:hypothetical protein